MAKNDRNTHGDFNTTCLVELAMVHSLALQIPIDRIENHPVQGSRPLVAMAISPGQDAVAIPAERPLNSEGLGHGSPFSV